MTHRAALILSVALTLILGVGVLIGRDWLFAAETGASPSATAPVAQSPIGGQSAARSEISPRVVEVALPLSLGANSASTQSRRESDEPSFDRDEDDRGEDDRDSYEDDHDDENHDDD
jgi:hypothetical protein